MTRADLRGKRGVGDRVGWTARVNRGSELVQNVQLRS